MNSIHFVIQTLPGTPEQLNDRLREVSEKVNKAGFEPLRVFEQMKVPVREVVFGPNHIGVLSEDGKAYRVPFSINSDRLDLTKNDSSKNGSSAVKNSAPSSSRQLARSRARLMRTTARSGSGQNSGSRSTGVIIAGSSSNRPLVTVAAPFVPDELISQAEVVLQGKSRNLIIRELQRTNLDVNLAVNNLLSRDDEEVEDNEEGADSYVPEDLISLLDNGFHGDNNSVIIDPADGLFSEEIFSNYSSIRNLLFDRIRSERNQPNVSNSDGNQSRLSGSNGGGLSGTNTLSTQGLADREAFSRWRDRQCYNPRRWINKEEMIWEKEAGDTKKNESSTKNSPIWISDELQSWPEKKGIRFKKIAALYSEFVALSESGDLHQWKWTEAEPYKSEMEDCYHPKTVSLNITEKVEHISASFIRASVVTKNNCVATWMDDQIGYFGMKLEHSAIAFSDIIIDPIVSIHVCSLFSAVRTESNNVYWWGVLPFEQRRILWEKNCTKSKKPVRVTSEITVGTQVIMKKCPIFQSGSIGFTCINGVPKVGQLLNSVWDFNDVSRFKILNVPMANNSEKISAGCLSNSNALEAKEVSKSSANPMSSALSISNSKSSAINSSNKESTDRIDMPPPPSPASSTCSDTGSSISHKRTKRMAAKDDIADTRKDEEYWQLKDVVIVEEKIGPIGKVLKVDGEYIAVRFPVPVCSNVSSCNISDGKEDDWQLCRLLRRDDVQIYKTALNFKGPDWLQKLPKKIHISSGGDNFQLLTLCVDTSGIHAIKKVCNKIHYSMYNLHNCKQEQNHKLTTDSVAFLGRSANNINMMCSNDNSGGCMILLDGNRTFYPFAKDCLNSIKDPCWLDLPPVKSFSVTTISLPASTGSNFKSKVCVMALLFECQNLMPSILRCDAKNVLNILNNLEKDNKANVLSIIEERCDGCRNIFHACIVMCAPTSNKEPEDKEKNFRPNLTSSFSNVQSDNAFDSSHLTNTLNATSGSTSTSAAPPTGREGRTVSLREMMNKLINNDNMEHLISSDNSNVNECVAEDHYYSPNWPNDSTTSPNSNRMEPFCRSEEDIPDVSKLSSSINIPGSTSMPSFIMDPLQRREQSIGILQFMCSSIALRPYLTQLLSSKDSQGQTPFMLAISCRSYDAAIVLLSTILNLSENDPLIQKEFMVFPPGSPPDMSPLYVICYNDTCSFTWTGADHINQNIFECKTCGLTGSLCCCTECARVCHKGHDCKLKRTSPTAYCDCWEKCKCKALIAGNQQKRYSLLCKLVSTTDLVSKFNSKGESILLFLIQTVGRQTIEQRQYRASSRARNVVNAHATSSSRKSSAVEVDSEMPDHDLEPPKFARRALERLLVDWPAVQSMIMTGAEKYENLNAENYSTHLQTQKGSTLLDKFTHNLFVKCGSEHLDTLLMTLIHETQNDFVEGRMAAAELVARRFIRSVVRVFVIFNLEKQPNPDKRKCSSVPHKHIQNCIKVFQNFHKISIQELCEAAEAIIAPVRSGVLRPTAPFTLSSSNIDCSDDLFSVEPLAHTLAFLDNVESMHGSSSESTMPGFNLLPSYDRSIETGLAAENEHSINTANLRSQDVDINESGPNIEVNQDDESDNDFTYNDAETESDSEDNQSNHDPQTNMQTRAAAGSDTDDSEESSPQDEEASEEGETDEHSDDPNSVARQQLERRNAQNNPRTDTTPQSMQWAIRSRDTYRSTLRVPPGSNLVFIDPMALRRSNVPASSSVTAPQDLQTLAATASNLARAFGITIRQISDLFNNISFNLLNGVETPLKLNLIESLHLQAYVESRLKPTWDWLFSVMDTAEAQLKFGAYLTNHTDPTHPLHPLNLSSQNITNQSSTGPIGLNTIASSRREFFTYCLSIMRAHTSEHLDALPVIDISSFKHIAYVFDAIIYYMRNDNSFCDKKDTTSSCSLTNSIDNYDTDEELSNITNDESFSDFSLCPTPPQRSMMFFSRSDSTLSLGCQPPTGFDLPIDEAIPLADKPQLLQPNAKRVDLFANVPLLTPSKTFEEDAEVPPFGKLPTRLGFSKYTCYQSPGIFAKNTKCEHNTQSDSSNSSKIAFQCSEKSTYRHSQVQKKPCSDENKPFFQLRSIDEALKSKTESFVQSSQENANKGKQNSTGRPGIIITPNLKELQRGNVDSDTPATNETKFSNSRTVIVRANASVSKLPDNLLDKNKKSENKQTINSERGYHFCNAIVSTNSTPSWNILIGRWKLTLELFGRVFMDDVGMENSSVLPELRGFPVKEMRFRRQMEKLRNGQQRDLVLSKLDRTRESLIIQTFKEFNTQFGNQNRRVQPPLAFNRVKVTFKDEPGEGSGVARSFYTTITEAILSSAKIPNLESVQIGSSNKYGMPFSSILRTRGSSGKDPQNMQKRGFGNKILWRSARERRILNHDARPFIPFLNNSTDNSTENPNEHLTVHLQQLGERLFTRVYGITPEYAQKVTGMILEIPTAQLLSIISSDELLRQKVNEALELITSKQNANSPNTSGVQSKKLIPVVLLEQCQVDDNEPLFYSPGKRGFYSPRQGYGTFERLNAFRNIGRLIGLCLQQNELLPLCLQRHVLKYILGRKIKFHDMAFFDPTIYESFRQLLQSAQAEGNEDIIKHMEIYFVIDLVKEEGGGSSELIPGGREVKVTCSNIYDYVKRYVEYRLIKSQKKALEALRDGVFEVLPETSISSLTAEDLRLLLNGAGDINVSTLISYTTFNDESSEGPDKLIKFKRWFWSIVEKMNTLERQDLIYFWTGSPALPASEEGFQPLPSVTIRPADDTHLPTANTCISRLYIPLYSCKTILRCKLLLAIKSKNFGFV